MEKTGDLEAYQGVPIGFVKMQDWLLRAQVNYLDLYIKLYIAYNAWYCEVTGVKNDRRALGLLKKRFVIWEEYQDGRSMKELRPYMIQLVELSQREPLRVTHSYWDGELNSEDDWQSLIECWYQVRCLAVHGETVDSRYVHLVYETLAIFMGEISRRVSACLLKYSLDEAKELARLSSDLPLESMRSERFVRLQQKLYLKYIALPSVWEVDMISV